MLHRDLFTKTLLAAVCAAAIAQAHSAGTTQASAGVPSEGDCTLCHTVGPIGYGSVTMTFSGGTTYQPGVAQNVSVTVTDSTASRWGFQLTARLEQDIQFQGGTFTPGPNGDTWLLCTNIGAVNFSQGTSCPYQQPLSYLEQTLNGTFINKKLPGSQSWNFVWTPPTDPNAGPIIFYVSGLASNNDGLVGGDITYDQRYVIQPAFVPTVPFITNVLNPQGTSTTFTPGEIVSVRGSQLSPTSRSISPDELINDQFPNVADGVQVTFGGVPGYIMALDPSRIRVVVPNTNAVGLLPVVVNNGTQSTGAYDIDVEAVAPAFFLWNNVYVQATHLDGTIVGPVGLFPGSTSSPAQPGETINITAVGLGPTDPSFDPGIVVPDGTYAPLVKTPLVLFNGVGVPAQGAALITGLPGVYNVVVQVPANAPDGDMPIQLQVSGVQSDTGFLLPIQAQQ
ncbi:MAG TPA: choice-of-anchor V domain-containing protein [Bryobacteraceae bacterium]|jgi:uncharacterized protein (TIGR03437 family)